MTRNEPSFGQLVRYINKPQEKGVQEVFHNLSVDGREDHLQVIEDKFIQNNQYAPTRTNGVTMYHDVISLSAHDQKHVTEEILLDIGRKYLEIRAPQSMGYCRVHFDKGNTHLHVMISGNEVRSKTKARVSKARLRAIKRELEAYQREQYPELENSRVQHGAKSAAEKARNPILHEKGRGEGESHRRHQSVGGGKSEKARVFALVQESIRGANNETDIAERLERVGLTIYRRGKTVGVLDTSTKKKYRLKTLGLEEAYTQTIERARLYAETTAAKSRNRVRALGIAADVLRVVKNFERVDTLGLEVKRKRKCGVEEVKREESWREILRQKRERRWRLVRGR